MDCTDILYVPKVTVPILTFSVPTVDVPKKHVPKVYVPKLSCTESDLPCPQCQKICIIYCTENSVAQFSRENMQSEMGVPTRRDPTCSSTPRQEMIPLTLNLILASVQISGWSLDNQ